MVRRRSASPDLSAEARSPSHLASLFEVPLDTDVNAIANVRYWQSLPWSRRTVLLPRAGNAAAGGPCRQQHSEIYNSQKITASYESLTEDQQKSGLVYYAGERYDFSGMVQCFAYHAPLGETSTDPEELVVVELLKYKRRGFWPRRPARASTDAGLDAYPPAPCRPASRC